jgi:hypothetical protein
MCIMTITTHGETFPAYQCEYIGVTGQRCSVLFTDEADIPLHMIRHKKTDEACIATEYQRKDGHQRSVKPKLARKRIIVTGAGLGRIKLTGYAHERKNY